MDGVNLEEVAAAVAAGKLSDEQVGVSWLQRRYRLGFRAATLLKQQLEAMGVVFVPIVWEDGEATDQTEAVRKAQP